jgi:hypothetical protein
MSNNSVSVVQIQDLPLADTVENGDILILSQNHHRIDQIYTPGKNVAKKVSISAILNYITSLNNISFTYGIEAYNFTSIAPQGAIPFNVTSDTLCPNLNVQYLNGKDSDYFVNATTNQSINGNKTFTGITSGTTAAQDTNTTQFASTAFVLNQASTTLPLIPSLNGTVGTSYRYAREGHQHPYNFTSVDTDIKMNGTQSVGALNTYPRADHIHPIDTSRAPVANPTFTGTVTAPSYTSTVLTGTAPMTVASTTMVTNLNANFLGGTALSGLSPVAGSTSITTLGTIATGTWNASTISPGKGGTGVANSANNTITFTGNYSLGLTLSAATTLTLPTSGTLATLAGTETLTNKTLISPTMTAPSLGIATGTSFNSITGLASADPLAPSITAVAGTSTLAARQDHVHPIDTSRQATLVSGTNIKTINNTSLLGSGNIQAGHIIKDEGSALTTRTNLNFVGSTVTVTDDSSNDATVVTVSAGITDGDKGDIIVSSNGTVWTIDNNTITLNKLARTGTAGQVLTSGGTGVDPTYADIPTQFTTKQAQDAAASLFTSGTHSQISFVYDDANNKINATVPTTITAGNADTVDGYHASSLAKADHVFGYTLAVSGSGDGNNINLASWGYGLYSYQTYYSYNDENGGYSIASSSGSAVVGPANSVVIPTVSGYSYSIYKLVK